MSEQMQTLNGATAHNAIASLTQMYAGILADYERQLSLANATIRALKAGEEAAERKIKGLEQTLENLRAQQAAEP